MANAGIFGSVLKGFAQEKRLDRMWVVYQEMKALNVQLSVVTYNIIIDAVVRSGEVTPFRYIIEEMASAKIEPDMAAYSAIIKGYCDHPENHLAQAFATFMDMKTNSLAVPDEAIYCMLLDGCTRQSQWNCGVALLSEMQGDGVPATRHTLDVVVQLAENCNRGRE